MNRRLLKRCDDLVAIQKAICHNENAIRLANIALVFMAIALIASLFRLALMLFG